MAVGCEFVEMVNGGLWERERLTKRERERNE